ncbi:hypothetical protein NE237_020332 [Protea cynaroides]|uniref:Uncharacterized protein n=1 Tax=Protea cynaroides TaxID=273540 RepID=A0A9Q0K2H5_9MAGN|nr:hypothetical protein NE237_020332 [Protea cynaroides]
MRSLFPSLFFSAIWCSYILYAPPTSLLFGSADSINLEKQLEVVSVILSNLKLSGFLFCSLHCFVTPGDELCNSDVSLVMNSASSGLGLRRCDMHLPMDRSVILGFISSGGNVIGRLLPVEL